LIYSCYKTLIISDISFSSKFKFMNSTANRPPKPPVPKFNMIGAGTDTPDFSEPDTEATNSSTCVQAVKDCSNLIALSERDNKGSKKLTALIEIMEE
jgi:hypothetical protein